MSVYVNDKLYKFQSTLPTRGSDAALAKICAEFEKISIHAPHEGERLTRQYLQSQLQPISIHAPHEGERPTASTRPQRHSRFQSTLPTRVSDGDCRQPSSRKRGISIHAPHEGERLKKAEKLKNKAKFQSTLPTRGSDQKIFNDNAQLIISIHAPHEGERPIVDLGNNYATTISIHAPHEGERLINGFRSRAERPFQSTLPTRGSDMSIFLQQRLWQISIHAPHEGERLHPAQIKRLQF